MAYLWGGLTPVTKQALDRYFGAYSVLQHLMLEVLLGLFDIVSPATILTCCIFFVSLLERVNVYKITIDKEQRWILA